MGVPVALELNGGGNPNAVFIFQAGSTLKTVSGSVITLTNGAQACNVFWVVGSAATFGTTSTFSGTVMAVDAITDAGYAIINGRLLADADNDNTGAVTLNHTTITVPTCLAPKITLVKSVIKDNGGTANIADWTLDADDGLGNHIFGATGAPAVTNAIVGAGIYTLSENNGPSGYTPSLYSCVINSVLPAIESNSLTLANSDVATCTITNDDIAPPTTGTLHVIKTLNNLHGGTLGKADFSFSVNNGTPIAFESDGQNDITVDVGTYSVTESAVLGYATSYDNCTNLDISGGGSATCTITNDDIAPVVRHSSSGSSVFPVFEPTITILSTPVVADPIVPKLPKTGYPPQEKSNLWNIVIGAGVLMLVSAPLVLTLKKSKI